MLIMVNFPFAVSCSHMNIKGDGLNTNKDNLAWSRSVSVLL